MWTSGHAAQYDVFEKLQARARVSLKAGHQNGDYRFGLRLSFKFVHENRGLSQPFDPKSPDNQTFFALKLQIFHSYAEKLPMYHHFPLDIALTEVGMSISRWMDGWMMRVVSR